MDLGEFKNYSYYLKLSLFSFLPKGPNKTKVKYYLTKIREISWTLIFREKEHQAGLRKKNLLLRVESQTVDEKTYDSDVTSGSSFGYT